MAYLVELIAEVYGVDVVALEVGEHDDLLSSPHMSRVVQPSQSYIHIFQDDFLKGRAQVVVSESRGGEEARAQYSSAHRS